MIFKDKENLVIQGILKINKNLLGQDILQMKEDEKIMK